MKKVLLISIAGFISFYSTAQKVEWEKTLGGKHAEYLYDALPTLDCGVLLVGSSLSENTGNKEKKSEGDFDYFVTKLDEYGATEWVQSFGGDGTDRLQSLVRTYDGGYLLAGTSTSGISGDKTSKAMGNGDIWLLKLDMTGAIQWQKTLGGSGTEKVSHIILSADGGYLLAASSASGVFEKETGKEEKSTDFTLITKTESNRGNLDYWLVKMDASGEVQWQKTLGGTYVDELRAAVSLPNGNYVLAGISNSADTGDKTTTAKGLNDWWLVCLDQDGKEVWQQSYGGEGDDQVYALAITQEGAILAGGYYTESKNSDFVLNLISPEGKLVHTYTYDQGNHDILTDIVANEDGTFLLSGYTKADRDTKGHLKKPEEGVEDYVVIKINAAGEETWRTTVGSNQKEVLTRSIETRDGGYILMGSSMPLEGGGTNDANFYIVKLQDKEKPVKAKGLLEAAPNPAVEYTAVILGYEYETGTCSVIDISGRVLQSFAIETSRTIPVNLKSYPDGLYIIRVQTENRQEAVKVIKYSTH